MDLQGTQSMVLAHGNAQIRLGTPPVVLKIHFSILPLCGLQLPLRKAFVLILTVEE